MKNLDFEWLTDEFMLYCRSTQLREKTMSSYEQTLHLFGRWLSDELQIYTVDKIAKRTSPQVPFSVLLYILASQILTILPLVKFHPCQHTAEKDSFTKSPHSKIPDKDALMSLSGIC